MGTKHYNDNTRGDYDRDLYAQQMDDTTLADFCDEKLGLEDNKNDPAVAVTSADAQALIPEIPLPTEVRFIILDKLPNGAAIRLDQASRSWRAVVSSKEFWQSRARTNSMNATLQTWKYRLAVDDLPQGRHTLADVQGFAFARHGGPPGVTAARIEFDRFKVEKKRQIDQALKDRGITSRAEYTCDAEGVADFEQTVAKAERRKALEDGLMAKGLVLRSNFWMGQYFINGCVGAKSLEDTIAIAETMHIVHAHASRGYHLYLDRKYLSLRANIEELRREKSRRMGEAERYWRVGRAKRYCDYDELRWQAEFRDEWSDAKSRAEKRAVKKFEEALATYNALPTEQKRCSRCACGRPIFPNLL
ncbi:hypothetical protein HDU86_005405 [Geranomyces michiganensis]|nr:hypothetical protein HDU86_005405 [Geranomyces michiganensis]